MRTIVDKRELLATHWLFGQFSVTQLDRIVRFTRIHQYDPKQVIFRKGEPGKSMNAVLRGRVRISSGSPTGKEVLFRILKPGDVFGEIALLDEKVRTADATAMEHCELIVLERRDFLPILERNPQVCVTLLSILCERIRETTEQVEDSLFLDLPSRLAKAILNLAEHSSRPRTNGIVIGVKLSQRELGNIVGMTRESINRQFKAWRRDGVLDVEAGHIVIKDLVALKRQAEASSWSGSDAE